MTRVWVTRAEGEEGELATELRQCGLTPVVEPVLEMHLVHKTLDDIAALQSNDWLVLTSPFALPERRVTLHSGDIGNTSGLCGSAKCPGRSVTGWMDGSDS